MNIEIKENVIHLDMLEQLRECMKMFGEYVSTPVLYPETIFLSEVRFDAEKLIKKKGDIFHSVVTKLLFTIKRSIPYL